MAYRNVRCELTELREEGSNKFTINAKYIDPNETLPMVEPNGEFDIRDSCTLRQVIQECEHTGCSSGRARAILIIADSCSTDCITRPPRDVAHREQPHELPTPRPLRTLFPPDIISFTEGYLTIQQKFAITNEVQVDVANMFQGARHSNSFEAAKTSLQMPLIRSLSTISPIKREDASDD